MRVGTDQTERATTPVPQKTNSKQTITAPERSDAPVRIDSERDEIPSHHRDSYNEDDGVSESAGHSRSSTMSRFSTKPAPPNHLDLPNSGAQFDANSIKNIDKPLPKSPGAKSPGTSKLGSFFGWGGQASPSSSHTTFSEDNTNPDDGRTFSSIPSPKSLQGNAREPTSRSIPAGIDVPKANHGEESYFVDTDYPPTPNADAEVGEMEEELRDISSELATSIRREMELEDLVERLQVDLETPRDQNRRTSDYFSDYGSGSSSLSKYGGDLNARADEVDRSLRKAERDKAQIRLDCQQKVDDERAKRKVLEKQIRQLEDKASQVDLLSINSLSTSGRLKDLEATCEDLRRRLAEEKQLKENFEDLLSALKSDLEASHNENNDLKDEVMPRLRARVEGLESQAAEQERLAYEWQQEVQHLKEDNERLFQEKEAQAEAVAQLQAQPRAAPSPDHAPQELLANLEQDLYHTEIERNTLRDEVVPKLEKRVQSLEVDVSSHEKYTQEMQQQVQTLRSENVSLSSARKAQDDMQAHMDFISEDGDGFGALGGFGLKRSSSVARSVHSTTPMRSRPSSMIFNKGTVVLESRDSLAERVKDVEAQRDALHRALKSLLERQEYQNKENEKKLKQLEMERDRALKLRDQTGRAGYDREVRNLRDEINALRRRADEAVEAKWQVERGLGGLKMDLDRAQQEIESLKNLLEDSGIQTPENMPAGSRTSTHSKSLEQAYHDLQKSYENSLERIQALEGDMPKDEDTERALKQLEKALADAISERDFARQEADNYRLSMESVYSNERQGLENESQLAEELMNSAKRVEELASQVRNQLASNAALRLRLAETIERGDREQKSNAERIMHMQGKLHTLEEALMTAQHQSEERVARHEEEVAHLKDARNTQLVRIKEKLQSPRVFSPESPATPIFSGQRLPRIDFTTSGKAQTVGEETQIIALKKRVEELERALEEADGEMEEVVGRMNVAQIEVMELQNEREESVRLTRRLQKMIEEERLKGFEQSFKSLSS